MGRRGRWGEKVSPWRDEVVLSTGVRGRRHSGRGQFAMEYVAQVQLVHCVTSTKLGRAGRRCSGERTRLACWFRRLAETDSPRPWGGVVPLRGKECSMARGRHRQHGRRARSPDACLVVRDDCYTSKGYRRVAAIAHRDSAPKFNDIRDSRMQLSAAGSGIWQADGLRAVLENRALRIVNGQLMIFAHVAL